MESYLSEEAKKISKIISIILIILLFIAVILYAGFRGYHAYNHSPSSKTNFKNVSPIPFPSITFCALGPVPLQFIECEIEQNGVEVSNCSNTMTKTTFNWEGQKFNCLTFNNAGTLVASNTNTELGIQLYINSSRYLPNQEPIMGALCMINEPGEPPELEQESSFFVDAGDLTEVWLRLYNIEYINDTEVQDYTAVFSSAGISNESIIDVDFSFTDPGIFFTKQYYSYTVDQWIGEVGGFACLLTFLHKAIMWIVMLILIKVKPKQARQLPMHETENQLEEQH